MNILIICHANTSRSIMAEEMLRRMLNERAPGHAITVRSGGIAPYARNSALVSMDARLALRDLDIHVPSDRTATDLKVHRHVIEQADLIIAMTREQIDMLQSGFPEAAGKRVLTLKELGGGEGDIEDPAGRGESFHVTCREEIRAAVESALPRLLAGN